MRADASTQNVCDDNADVLANDHITTTLDPATHERWSKLPRPRGRQPRDPQAQSVRFVCQGGNDLEVLLREYLGSPSAPAEHATLEFIFPISAVFTVCTRDTKETKKALDGNAQQPQRAISVSDALTSTEEPKDQMRSQKAIARICAEAIEKADGYRYSFHNSWLSRDDESWRFSYYCNDSTLNKGRAANEGAGVQGRQMRKPVYDCHGLIAIKFSATKQSLEVHYKHIPIHKTYAERAPPPRHDSKRRKLIEPCESNIPSSGRRKRDVQQSLGTRIASVETAEGSGDADGASTIDLTRRESVSELIEPPRPANNTQTQCSNAANEHRTSAPSGPDAHSPATSSSLPASRSARQENANRGSNLARPRKAVIPGTMTGKVRSGLLNWRPRNDGKEARKTSRSAKDIVPSADQAANDVGSVDTEESTEAASTEPSELEILKRKLEEAEQRIKRLESERVAVPQFYRLPPQIMPSTVPSHPFAFSPQQPSISPFPNQPSVSTQSELLTEIPPRPPQLQPIQHASNALDDQLRTSLSATSDTVTTPAPSAQVRKITSMKPVNSKFIVFTQDKLQQKKVTKSDFARRDSRFRPL